MLHGIELLIDGERVELHDMDALPSEEPEEWLYDTLVRSETVEPLDPDQYGADPIISVGGW